MAEPVRCGLCGATERGPHMMSLTSKDDECHVCGLVTCTPCWRSRLEEHSCHADSGSCAAEECARAEAAAQELLHD